MAGKKYWRVPNYYCQYYYGDGSCRCKDVKQDINNEMRQNTTGKCEFNQCPIRKRKLDTKKMLQNMPKVREIDVSGKSVTQIDVKKESERKYGANSESKL